MKRLVQALLSMMMCLATGAVFAADLPLGAGDVMKVSVYGSPDLTLETRVSEGGSISFPLIGQVAVAGLSTQAAEQKIAQALDAGGFLKKPQVNIIVTQVQSSTISVLGQVNRPGRYPVDGGDKISLIRKREGKTVREEIDLVQMMRAGELAENYTLVGGDVVFVERAPKFYIYGEVQRPGAVRLERAMTVTQALSAGGGLSLRGTERGLVIKRKDAQGQLQTIKARADDLIQVDDVVYVKESWF
jgi:polysaccharide export outer membrane protein